MQAVFVRNVACLIRINIFYFSALRGVRERCSQRHFNLEMLFEAKICYNYIKDLVASSNRSYHILLAVSSRII